MTRGYIAENETQRQLKASEVVRKAIVESLAKGKFLSAKLFDVSITVTKVKVSVDLRHAYIYVLPFGMQDDVVEELNDISYLIRKDISGKVNFKFAPQIKFFWDDSFDHAQRINNLMDSNAKQHDEK